ncbi:unnamed protein product, partial [marine sediment metagenome]
MNSLKNFNFKDKRVLVRCDFNVPIKEGKILDDFKIQKALDTITYLKRNGAKIILCSHLEKYSLIILQKRLEELLKEQVKFSKKVIGRKVEKKAKKLKPGEILLLENLRFEKGEEKNDEKFAKALAKLAEVYVNEAFPTCHRNHASVVSLPKLLPSYAGLNLEKEIEVLTDLSQSPVRPLVVII